jgi:osmoprotectant transport system ATP-binding protein
MTIADNIAIVPKMLGWDRKRIAERTEVLLDMVGLKMATHGNRYPRQLSGGQQQRVGVARALAADPPVLLMDEPFGATDPITREHLQDELLRIQATVRKTIVFVTHDIDEAIKLGDKIAVLREQSRIAQYGTPDEILSRPADAFVSNFVGVGASLKRLQVITVAEALARHGDPNVPGIGTPEPLATGAGQTIRVDEKLHSALDKLLSSSATSLPVIDANGLRQGVLTIDTVIRELRSTHGNHTDDANGRGESA